MTSLLTAATRFKRTKAAAVMRALLCWQDGKKKKKKKKTGRENETAANEGSLPYEVWKGCAKAVPMCVKKKEKITKKKNVSNSPMLSARRNCHQAAERANHTQGAHIGTITHSDTCASQAFLTQAAYFAQRWTRCERRRSAVVVLIEGGNVPHSAQMRNCWSLPAWSGHSRDGAVTWAALA